MAACSSRHNRSAGRPATACRSARPRTRPCVRRCSGWSAGGAVELRREESRRAPQNGVRPAQLTNLALELGKPARLVGGGARTGSLIDLGLGHPVAQRLGVDAQLLADPGQRTRAGGRITPPPPPSGWPAPAARRGTSSVPP